MTSFASNDQECIERSIALDETAANPVIFDNIDDQYDILETRKWISDNEFKRVCLQFPDDLLGDSAQVVSRIQAVSECNVYVLGDTSYGSCCVDEVASQHIIADCIVHYGHACFSPSSIPVKYIAQKQFLSIAQVTSLLLAKFESEHKIGIFFDFSYHYVADELFKEILRYYPNALLGKMTGDSADRQLTDRSNSVCDGDVLCDYDCVYVGSKQQTMFNLSLTSCGKTWTFLDCNTLKLEPLDNTKWFKRRRYLVELCKDAKNIGILICTLSVHNFLEVIDRAKKLIKSSGRRSYIISVGKPNIAKLANLSEIDIFVLIACPESELYGSADYYKPIIYPCELEAAILNENFSYENYYTAFDKILKKELPSPSSNNEPDVSLITGRVRDFSTAKGNTEGSTNEVTDVQQLKMALQKLDVGSGMDNKTWKGLQRDLGKTEVKLAEVGRSGTTLGYDDENALK